MSTNCLVKKLKGSVDNNNIPYLGGLIIVSLDSESPTQVSQWCVVEGDNITATPLVGSMQDSTHIAPGSEILYRSIYNVRSITFATTGSNCRVKTPFKDFKYAENLVTLQASFLDDNIDELANMSVKTNLEKMYCRAITKVKTSTLMLFPNLKEINFPNISTVTGSLSDLISLLSLQVIALGSAYSGTLTGTIEDLAEGQVNNGRTTGTITIYGSNLNRRDASLYSNNGYVITFDDSVSGGYSITNR